MKEIRKFLIVFGVALLVSYIGFKLVVSPCKMVTANTTEFKDCTCIGKKINIAQLLGNKNALEVPYVEQCLGVVKNRT